MWNIRNTYNSLEKYPFSAHGMNKLHIVYPLSYEGNKTYPRRERNPEDRRFLRGGAGGCCSVWANWPFMVPSGTFERRDSLRALGCRSIEVRREGSIKVSNEERCAIPVLLSGAPNSRSPRPVGFCPYRAARPISLFPEGVNSFCGDIGIAGFLSTPTISPTDSVALSCNRAAI